MSERGAPTPTPTDELRRFGQRWVNIYNSPDSKPQDFEDLLAAFTTAFIVMPIAEYVGEVNAMGEWQARARKVINAANAVFDVNQSKGHSEFGAQVVLRRTLIANDFRVEEN